MHEIPSDWSVSMILAPYVRVSQQAKYLRLDVSADVQCSVDLLLHKKL